MDFDLFLRISTILIFALLRIYWYITKQKAEKTKKETNNKLRDLEKLGMIIAAIFILLNLLGFTIVTFTNTTFQLVGLLLVIMGCGQAVIARHTLGKNWTPSYEYHIKKNHQLITNGIYRCVRHPIYGGLMIAVTGAFIVSKTYLFIPTLFFQMIIMFYLAKREENLLEIYFGSHYISYKQKTNMFIPFVF